LSQMTIAAQSEAQSGPGTEGLPNNVNSGAGPGHRDDAGEWQVEQGESNHAANSTLTP